ncbi:hypothetical protein ACFWYW_56710 [Nonomuraea sp. NPDC059023]|uniref:hypothetical protein n=1 Tax=unclassified Nonomuraea TaxID=2593643 RepID=UPI0036844F79
MADAGEGQDPEPRMARSRGHHRVGERLVLSGVVLAFESRKLAVTGPTRTTTTTNG